jgi:hypothetical protein
VGHQGVLLVAERNRLPDRRTDLRRGDGRQQNKAEGANQISPRRICSAM